MRRLQANLGYLAAIADRPNKPSSQIPPHPAIISAPPLIARPGGTATSEPSEVEPKKEEADDKSGVNVTSEDRYQRIETLKSQYKKLQDLFPGVDPKKEPPAQPANAGTKQAPNQAQGQKAQSGQGLDANAQQKLQNDQLRQKMMMQAQAQAQAQAQGR